ncbi:MAG: hypothetical protein FWD92_02225 [Methanomassiliicoccaceae archaeon]|nr:hypothetical protein [Methanomassiliicoccaceae archaeon]
MKFDLTQFDGESFAAPKKKYPTKEDFLIALKEQYCKCADITEVYGDWLAFRHIADSDYDCVRSYTFVEEGSSGAFPVWVAYNTFPIPQEEL